MDERHLMEPNPEASQALEESQSSEATQASPTPTPAKKQGVPVWLWIGLAGGVVGMCVLCGGVLAMLGVIGALSSGRPTHPTAWQTAPAAPDSPFYSPYGSAGDGFDMGRGAYTPMPNYDFGSGAGDGLGWGSSDGLSDSIRQHSAENSWWAEEWSRALGDNYPEPTHVDPDGNPGWIDHSGAFHDYNSGMSDYESSTLGGGYGGE